MWCLHVMLMEKNLMNFSPERRRGTNGDHVMEDLLRDEG